MMNSSYDDDEFAPNPFRSQQQQQQQGQVPPPPAQQMQQQPPMQQQQGGGFYNPAGGSMAGMNVNQPDPYSGMTGSMDIPASPPSPPSHQMQQQQQQQMMQGQTHQMMQQQQPMQQQQQQPPPHDPTQWSGAMDQRAAPTENYGANRMAGANPNAPGGGGLGSRFGWRSCVSCFSLDSYVRYFDLETVDVLERLKSSLFQFYMPDQFRTAVVGDETTVAMMPTSTDPAAPPPIAAPQEPASNLKGPDLYGPVWISFTLIFVIAVTSNIHAYWTHKRHAKTQDEIEEFDVDIRRLLHASTVVLVFVFCISSAFWIGTSCMGMPGISWAMWVCCYGYSQVPYLLASILIAVLPFELISWCALGGATAASALLILRNLSTPLMAQDSASHAKAAPFILAILGAHTIYFFVIKVMFFP